MLIEGHFILVFNADTILSTHESLSGALRAAQRHSVSVSRGSYEIFELGKPVKTGTVGEALKWE